jgi:hypothetical protein
VTGEAIKARKSLASMSRIPLPCLPCTGIKKNAVARKGIAKTRESDKKEEKRNEAERRKFRYKGIKFLCLNFKLNFIGLYFFLAVNFLYKEKPRKKYLD